MSRRHPLSERFHELLRESGDLHDRKQRDYGNDVDPFANVRASEASGIPGWCGAVIRGNDKMIRLQKAVRQYLETGVIDLANETLEESCRDLAVYALIALVLYEESTREP